MRRHYNLVLMVIWLAIAVIILAPEGVAPPKLRQQFGGPLQLPVAILALVLAAYNGVRWWAYRSLVRNRPAAPVNPLAIRRRETDRGEDEERNPDFDFTTGPGREGPPRPSANGDER
jgi:hypothetical protein